MATLETSLQEALAPRYRILEPIGAGGMATVFRAWDSKHDRDVAIKVLDRPSDEKRAQRFRREIRIAAKLSHPNILPLHDSGEAAGALYFVMPLAEASTLRQLLAERGRLPLGEAIRIVTDVAEGLDYAHKRGVVHRDVKPGNILLESGRALVSDFGIALAEHADLGRAADDGLAVGTVAYMSPEQARGAEEIGPQSDVYALACVAFEMLAGEPVFKGSTAWAILAQKVSGEVRALDARIERAPRAIRPALRKALTTDPSLRFESAGGFADALRKARQKPARTAIGALAAAGIGLAAALTVVLVRPPGRTPSLVPDRAVVGPVQNQTGDPRLDWFPTMAVHYLTEGLQAGGLTDVVPVLTAIPSARAALAAADSGHVSDPILEVGRDTRAGLVISGGLFTEGNGLRFRMSVTDLSGRRDIASPPGASASLGDSLGLVRMVREVTDRVTGALALSLDDRLPRSVDASGLPTYAAYRAFSEGLDHYLEGDWAGAIPAFLRSFEEDSTFVSALFYAALNHSNQRQFAEADSLLRVVALQRERLTPYDRHWLDYRQALLAGDRPRALRAIRAAAQAAPGSKAVYNWGIEAMEGRRLTEAVAALQRLPPNQGPVRSFFFHLGALSVCHHLLGDYRSSLRVARQARELFPDLLWPRGWELASLVALGRTTDVREGLSVVASLGRDATGRMSEETVLEVAQELAVHGHRQEAIAAYQSAVDSYERRKDASSPSEADRFGMAEALVELERLDEARELAGELVREHPSSVDYVALHGRIAALNDDSDVARQDMATLATTRATYLLGSDKRAQAFIAAALGNTDEAVDLLRAAFNAGFHYGPWIHTHPALAPLRGLPEFQAIAAPIQ